MSPAEAAAPATPGVLYRAVTLAPDSPNTGTRADGVEVCLSSEAPVDRTDPITGRTFREVLDHGPGGVDMSHAPDGTVPLFFEHDQNKQIGIVRGVRVDSDRRMRGVMYFGHHPDYQWVADDIRAGIRPRVSVGYTHEKVLDRTTPTRPGDPPTIRFRWKLLEASTVSLPANPEVGIGRSAALHPTAPTAGAPHTRNHMSEPNTVTREAQLAALASNANMTDKLPGWIMNGIGVEQARAEALAHFTAPAPMNPTVPFGAIASRAHAAPQDDASVAAFTSPESAAARSTTTTLIRDMGFAPRMGGNFLALDVATLNRPTHSRVLTTTGSTTGAELVPKVQMNFTEQLREDLVAPQVGVRFISMSGGTAAMPVATADPTVVEIAENPGSGAALSDPAFATREAKPKAAVIRCAVSNHIALASTPEAVATVSGIMARTLADHMDGRIFAGPTGGNGPIGAFFTSGVSTHPLGATGAALGYTGLVDMEKALVDAKGEAEDVIFLSTSAVRAKLQQTQDFPSASAGRPLWENGRVLGRPAFSRSWMPSTLTKSTGTDLHGALMYSPRRAGHLVVTWPAVEITVDRITGADKQLTYLTAALYYDVVVLHPGAVVRVADIDVS